MCRQYIDFIKKNFMIEFANKELVDEIRFFEQSLSLLEKMLDDFIRCEDKIKKARLKKFIISSADLSQTALGSVGCLLKSNTPLPWLYE